MKKFSWKKALLVATAYLTVIALAIGGTLAYLQDEDSDVNVMTLGNVDIDQIEQQRDENGNLVDFVDGKPALPAVGPIEWADEGVDVNGTEYKVFTDDLKNVIDKIVTVKNTGKSPAYVRTIIVIEAPDYDPENLIHVNVNPDGLTQTAWAPVELDGVKYVYSVFTYTEALKPDEISAPSLMQVFLDSDADNEFCEKLGDTWEIIAISQAVQVDGFENAATALDIAFEEPSAANIAEWLEKAYTDDEAKKKDTWDGTSDTSWYNDTDTEFTLTTAEQLAGLAELVDGGNTFEGKTIKLDKDFDLKYIPEGATEPKSFEPAGSFSDNVSFKGVFDGQGHTISNMYQNGWALQNGYWDGPEYGMGLFSLVEDATVKNLVIDAASLPTEANIIGVVAGGAGGECVFENISVTGAYLGNHSWYSGGLVGWAEGDQKFINCDIDATSCISSQWGDFNNANGGLVGGIDPEGEYYFEDCDVACVIDAYNDVTSAYEWYSYRNCGMLIGDTGKRDDPDGNNVGNAIAPNVTCKNVTVTYGEWANYHYCQFNSSGYPFCRVEAGESTGAYGNARVGEYFDANGNKVVDDNHVHNDGEKHNELIVFDQLYGGESGDRYCTYGTATHPGVTVVYNNK